MNRMERIVQGQQDMTDKEFAFYEMLRDIKESLETLRRNTAHL